jgi:LPS-assembly protein
VNQNWALSASATWDIKNEELIRRGLGVTYSDECTVFTVTYTDKPASTDANAWTVMARISFRTLGDINVGSDTTE